MMSALILALLGFGVAFAFIGSDDDDDVTVDDPPEDDDPQRPSGDDSADIIYVSDGLTDDGSDDDDLFVLSTETNGAFTANLSGGAGDDIFRLTNLGESAFMAGSVDGGDGDDYIEATGEADISGGAGNDTITAASFASSVEGGTGDDLLRIRAGGGDVVFVDGGAGDDTIDGTGSENVVFTGGAGDDLIVSNGLAQGGAGYNIIAEGGDGNDTLSHSVDVFPFSDFDTPAILRGGDGADQFFIALTTSTGSFEPGPDDPDVFVTPAGVLEDFVRGTDSLEIDLSMIDPFYTEVSAAMVEDLDTGSTGIILSLSGETLPDQDVIIRVNATDLSWDDVTFVGEAPSILSSMLN
jgi:Ca2+-binding RTX toxin-like protein